MIERSSMACTQSYALEQPADLQGTRNKKAEALEQEVPAVLSEGLLPGAEKGRKLGKQIQRLFNRWIESTLTGRREQSAARSDSSQCPARCLPRQCEPQDVSADEVSQQELSPGQKPFKEFMGDLIQADVHESMSEARLQYGIISYQLYQKSSHLQHEFERLFQSNRDEGLSIKDAAKEALVALGDTGEIVDWEVDWVYSLSHRAAQLDKSHAGINPASAEDISFEDALARAESALVGIQSASIEVKDRGPQGVGWIDFDMSTPDNEERENG